MNEHVLSFAYHSVIALGVAGLVALLILAGYGILRIYVWVLDVFLLVKGLREMFREFMYTRARENVAQRRKARK